MSWHQIEQLLFHILLTPSLLIVRLHVRVTVVPREPGQPGSVVVDHVVGAVGRTHDLQRDQQDVQQLPQEHEAEGAQLEQSKRGVAQVEPVHPEHAQKDGQEQRHAERMSVCPFAVHLPLEAFRFAVEAFTVAYDAFDRITRHLHLGEKEIQFVIEGRIPSQGCGHSTKHAYTRARAPHLLHVFRTVLRLLRLGVDLRVIASVLTWNAEQLGLSVFSEKLCSRMLVPN